MFIYTQVWRLTKNFYEAVERTLQLKKEEIKIQQKTAQKDVKIMLKSNISVQSKLFLFMNEDIKVIYLVEYFLTNTNKIHVTVKNIYLLHHLLKLKFNRYTPNLTENGV